MSKHVCDYLIVGAGLAGTSAADGIRELDPAGSIVLIGEENHLPYDRPPLTKSLWSGKTKVENVYLHDQAYYDHNGVMLIPSRRIVSVDAENKTAHDNQGEDWSFGKLLLATGGLTRPLRIPGGDLREICYYRYLDDYERMRRVAESGKSAVIVGGGFIGSELAASLCGNGVKVTMIYPAPYLCDRVFPESLALAMEEVYRSRGIRILKGRKPASFERADDGLLAVQTDAGERIVADMVIVGVGILPAVDLAVSARLAVEDGVLVNAMLQTSHPDIYAAGDNARFPYRATGPQVRFEHWDNALNQGKQAGQNMAGAHAPYTHISYFFSDLFEFGYEAVGEIDPRLEVVADWQKENEKGILYYRKDGRVRGAMMCNVWNKVPEARELIRKELGSLTLKLEGSIA